MITPLKHSLARTLTSIQLRYRIFPSPRGWLLLPFQSYPPFLLMSLTPDNHESLLHFYHCAILKILCK
jgi:hypothetical protein